jgi:hypothetical protein
VMVCVRKFLIRVETWAGVCAADVAVVVSAFGRYGLAGGDGAAYLYLVLLMRDGRFQATSAYVNEYPGEYKVRYTIYAEGGHPA